MNEEETATTLVSHRDTNAIATRLEVTSSRDRRRNTAKTLSTAIKTIVKNDAQVRRYIAK